MRVHPEISQTHSETAMKYVFTAIIANIYSTCSAEMGSWRDKTGQGTTRLDEMRRDKFGKRC